MCELFVSGYLSSDHHPVFRSYQSNVQLRCLGSNTIKTILYVPVSHSFVKRLIGSVRREYLEHVLFWNAPIGGESLRISNKIRMAPSGQYRVV